MRLHPPVPQDEALQWLVSQSVAYLGIAQTPELEAALTPLAEAMAAISAVVLPDDLEPMFP